MIPLPERIRPRRLSEVIGQQHLLGDRVLTAANGDADRLARVRIVHGDWSRCLNHHYGDTETAVFLDPPYRAFEKLYSDNGTPTTPVADDVAAWAREHGHLRVALCGHRGDYDMPGWSIMDWSRGRLTYGGKSTTDAECIWFSPGCLPDAPVLGAACHHCHGSGKRAKPPEADRVLSYIAHVLAHARQGMREWL